MAPARPGPVASGSDRPRAAAGEAGQQRCEARGVLFSVGSIYTCEPGGPLTAAGEAGQQRCELRGVLVWGPYIPVNLVALVPLLEMLVDIGVNSQV